MTSLEENFDTLDTNRWMKVIAAGDVVQIAGKDQIHSTGANNALVYSEALTVTNITVHATLPTVTLSSDHGFAVGATFTVTLSNTNSTPALDGVFVALAVTSNSFSVSAATTVSGSSGSCVLPKQLTGVSQKVHALVYATAQSNNHSVILWARYDRAAGIGQPRRGYGIMLRFDEGGTRSLLIVKIHPDTGFISALAEKFVTLQKVGGLDLGPLQYVKATFTDIDADPGSGQAAGVRIRAFINQKDDGIPDLEVVDEGTGGVTTVAVAQPLARDAGTWAILLGEQNVVVDSFAAEDTFQVPDQGDYGWRYRTLAQLRSELESKLALGGQTNYDESFLNEMLNQGVREVEKKGSQSNYIWDRFEEMTLTANNNGLIEMPWDVKRVHDVFHAGTRSPFDHRVVSTSDKGRLLLLIEPQLSSTTCLVSYRAHAHPMRNDTDYCDVPIEHDELVVLAAALRILEADNEPGLYERYMNRFNESLSDFMKANAMHWKQKRPVMRVVGQYRRRSRPYSARGLSRGGIIVS